MLNKLDRYNGEVVPPIVHLVDLRDDTSLAPGICSKQGLMYLESLISSVEQHLEILQAPFLASNRDHHNHVLPPQPLRPMPYTRSVPRGQQLLVD